SLTASYREQNSWTEKTSIPFVNPILLQPMILDKAVQIAEGLGGGFLLFTAESLLKLPSPLNVSL
ncbi:MAG: hypothetical protein OSB34_07455, partial [Planktomarina sp.]|nr:hypothetical protein [Planktomarina sp.]